MHNWLIMRRASLYSDIKIIDYLDSMLINIKLITSYN